MSGRAMTAALLGGTIALMAAGAALAAGGGGGHGEAHGLDPKTLALQLLNFGVLLFLLLRFGGGAVNKALRNRHEQLKADLEEANRLREAAEQRFKEQEARLANLEKELASLRASFQKDAAGERARLVAAAEEKARRIQDETRFQLEQQVKEAQIRLRNDVAAAALHVAEDLLRRGVSAADEQRLAQGFVADLASGRGGAGRGGETAGQGGGRPGPHEEVVS